MSTPFAIQIEFLTGKFYAIRHSHIDHAEWPPEPDRLFCACIAALYASEPKLLEEGRKALQWLEEQGAPQGVACSAACFRTIQTNFVPINDELTLNRGKRPRTFPCAIPADPKVTYIWQEPPPAQIHKVLTTIIESISVLRFSKITCVRLHHRRNSQCHIPIDLG